MTPPIHLDRVTMVLHRPRYPENIGAAARAVCNMGIGGLAVVAPERFDMEAVARLATHAAGEVTDAIRRYDDLSSAVADCGFVVGTTARLGGQRETVLTPASMARQLISITRENRVAIVFGPEDRGLTNEDLRLCHRLVHIPTASFSSINLAQAVMIISYTLFTAAPGDDSPAAPRLATRYELDGMYDQLKDILSRIHYINPENPDYWMHHLRQFFTRIQLRAKEVSIIRGICRQVDWYAGKRYRDGYEDGRRGDGGGTSVPE